MSRRPWRRRDTALSSDRGSGPVEFAVLSVAMLMLAGIIIQAGLVYHARSVALGAATQGVNVARGYQNDPAAGVAHAEAFLNQVGGGLENRNVTYNLEDDNGEAVVITVTGDAISMIPGLRFRIRQSARGSVEQFVED